MIRIPIQKKDVENAKEIIKKFDVQKTYDKFECKNNYLGVLGEMILAKWLDENHHNSKWVGFVKEGWEEPDFIINNQSIDLKTTRSGQMWIQEPKFDIYIFSRINKGDTELLLLRWIKKKKLLSLKNRGKLTEVEREGRKDWTVEIPQMTPIEEFNWHGEN